MIAREQKNVRDLAPKPARHVDKLGESDDGRARHGQALGANRATLFCLDDFRFPIDDKPQRTAQGHHGERLVRRIQCKTPGNHNRPPCQVRILFEYIPEEYSRVHARRYSRWCAVMVK